MGVWVWVVCIRSIYWYARVGVGGCASTADIGMLDMLFWRYVKRRVHGEGGLKCCIGISAYGMHGNLVCKSEGRFVYRDYYREIITRYAYIRIWYANQLCGMHC